MKYVIKVVLCLLLILLQSPVYALDVKPFISFSFIKANSSDWLNPDYQKGKYVKPSQGATIKAGISVKEENVTIDLNLYHLSNPSNGTIGDFKEGDSGINGFEWGVRYDF